MKIVEQSCSWIQPLPANVLEVLEICGRVCYKSEERITPGSAEKFVETIQNSGHASVIEHGYATMRFITDRGVTHEIVRHRIASYSQESTRYCNYGKGKFGSEITVVLPVWFRQSHMACPPSVEVEDTSPHRDYIMWKRAMSACESYYMSLIDMGQTAQQARAVLPNSLKTEIAMTANLREWLHFFELRCSPKAHPQMRDLAIMALHMFNKDCPLLFGKLANQ